VPGPRVVTFTEDTANSTWEAWIDHGRHVEASREHPTEIGYGAQTNYRYSGANCASNDRERAIRIRVKQVRDRRVPKSCVSST
jgi:hypothetical protein